MQVMDKYYSYGLGIDVMPNDNDWGDQFLSFCSQKGLVGAVEYDNPNIFETADGMGLVCKTGTGNWEGRPGMPPKQVSEPRGNLVRMPVQPASTPGGLATSNKQRIYENVQRSIALMQRQQAASTGGLAKILPVAAVAMVALVVLK